jgi:F420H(2)-dependent quinone reductase
MGIIVVVPTGRCSFADLRLTFTPVRARIPVTARRAEAAVERQLWAEFARLNPGFDESRSLTERQIPVVLLEPE